MDTFTLVRRSLDATADDPEKAGLNAKSVEIGRVTTAVQAVVDVLTPPYGGRYIVGFSDIATAQTSLGDRRITVSSKPLHDQTLTLVERAVVIATFAAHEIGHTYVTAPRKALIATHNPHSGYHAVANLADDIILEPVMVDRFPILADAFEFTGQWVLRTTAGTLPKQHRLRRDMTTPERFNLLLSATRYGDIPEIVWQGKATIAERDWCRTWSAALLAARLDDHDTFLALCDEAWVRIRQAATDEDEAPIKPPDQTTERGPKPPEDEAEDDEQDEDEDDESDSEPGESDDDESEDDEDGDESDGDTESDDEPTDEDGEDEGEGGSDDDAEDDEQDEDGESEDGESDEDGDEDGEDTDEGNPGGDDGEDDGEDGEPGGDEPTGQSTEDGDEPDANDQPRDWDDDEGEDDESESEGEGEGDADEDGEGDEGNPGTDQGPPPGETDATGNSREGAQGGGGNPETNADDVRDEDDFDQSKVDSSMHDQSERDPRDWEAREVDQMVRRYSSTTVTKFGAHGSMSTTWS